MTAKRRVLTAILAAGAVAAAVSPTATAQESPDGDRPHVVLVGVAGLSWPDVTASETPTLYELAGSSGAASLTVRTIRSRTCPVDGWLTVGAGRRAADLPDTTGDGDADRFCREPPGPLVSAGTTKVPGWDALDDLQARQNYGTVIGSLGSRLEEAGICSTAVGPGAALALANESGEVGSYLDEAEQLTTELIAACPVTVVDLGALPVPGPLQDDTPERRSAAAEVAPHLADLVDRLPDGTALLVAGVSDSGPAPPPGADEPYRVAPSGLRVALAAGPAPDGQPFGPRWLSSSTTRWTGLVQLTDLHATLAAYAGLPNPAADTVGAQWRATDPHPAEPAETVGQLIGADRATEVFRTQSGPFFQILGIAQVLFFGGALLWLRYRPADRGTVLRVVQYVALGVAAFPVASFLANLSRWWLVQRADLVLWASIVAITLGIAAVVLAGPWRHRAYGPPGVLAAFTATVLAVDVATGANLQHSSLLGLSPVVAGRFFGFGNIPFAIFVASVLIATAALAQWLSDRGHSRRRVTGAAAAIGLVAVVIMSAPWAGTNFGGTLSTIPGIALLLIGISGARITVWKLAVAGVAAAAFALLVAWLDWLRPDDSQTHFGAFFSDLLDGQALEVVQRKAEASLGTLQRSPYYGWLVPIAYLVIGFLVYGKGVSGVQQVYRRWPVVRYAIWASLLTGAVAFATNDSGIIIPALLLTTGIPLVVSAVAHAVRDVAGPPGPPAPEPRVATAGPGAPGNASQSQ